MNQLCLSGSVIASASISRPVIYFFKNGEMVTRGEKTVVLCGSNLSFFPETRNGMLLA